MKDVVWFEGNEGIARGFSYMTLNKTRAIKRETNMDTPYSKHVYSTVHEL